MIKITKNIILKSNDFEFKSRYFHISILIYKRYISIPMYKRKCELPNNWKKKIHTYMKNCFHSLHLLTMFIVRVQFHDVYAVIVKEYNKKNTVRLLKRTSKTIKSVFRGYLLQNLAGFGYLFSMFQGGIFLFPIFFF